MHLHKVWGYYAPKIEHYAFEQCSKNHLLCSDKMPSILKIMPLILADNAS